MHCLGIGQHDNHFFCALGKGSLNRLRHVDLVAPLLSTNGKTVQSIHNRVAAMLVLVVAWRQKDNGVPVNCVSLQIALQSRAVDLDVLHDCGLCAGDHRRYDSLHLRGNSRNGSHGHRQHHCAKQIRSFHRGPHLETLLLHLPLMALAK
jgi:hypothetical protein